MLCSKLSSEVLARDVVSSQEQSPSFRVQSTAQILNVNGNGNFPPLHPLQWLLASKLSVRTRFISTWGLYYLWLLVSYFTMRRNRRKYNHRREALMRRRRVQKWTITNFLTREKTVHIIYIATYSMYVSCALNAKHSSRLCCCPPCRHILTCLQSRTRAVTPPSIRVEPTSTHIGMWVGNDPG